MDLIRAGSNDTITTARKTVTFTGAAGVGAVGTVALFTVTGSVIVEEIAAQCTTDLVSAGAGNVSLGVTGNTAIFIAATVATALDNPDPWVDASPTEVGAVALPTAMKQILVTASLILTVDTGDVTAGVLQFEVTWRPVSSNGALVAA